MIRGIIAAPFLLVLVLFGLSNTEDVQLKFWPTDYALVAPLSVAILVACAIAFLLGALLLWLSVIAAHSKLRRSERVRRELEADIRELKARRIQAPMPRAVTITPPMPTSGAPALLPPGRAPSELSVSR